MAKWCNSFIIVPKPNDTILLCLDPAKLNQALIRPIHRGPTLNDILPKPPNACYMNITDTTSHHQNLKLDLKKFLIFNHVFMSIWHVQFHQTTIGGAASRRHVPAQN